MAYTFGMFLRLLLLAAVLGSAHAQVDGAKYLIVCPDSFSLALEPLADWKTAKGAPARIVTLEQTGATPTLVRAFIQQAWQNWPVKPEYVLIAASPEILPGFDYEVDTRYGDMTGDYQMELAVGRLPAASVAQCRMMVAKTMWHDRLPDLSDSLWFLRGTTVVGEEDTVFPDSFYFVDTRWARQVWTTAGYTLAESLSNFYGDDYTDVENALNDGRAYIGYRGVAGGFWAASFWEFWPNENWRNGRRMPVFVSATCATVTLAPREWMLGNMAMQFGTEDSFGGAVAFFGTTMLSSAVARNRGAVFRGFFRSAFLEGEDRLGPATVRARFLEDSLFHDQERYEEWALLGDPELSVWTGVPERLAVAHDTVTPLGVQQFAVTAGVPGARVCCWMDSAVYVVDTTDVSGTARLRIAPGHPGVMRVTVSGRNLQPYEGSCRVEARGEGFVGLLRFRVYDPAPGGNGDGSPGPGETFGLPLWVMNYGDSSAATVSAVLAAPDTLAAVLDSTHAFGTLAAHDSAYADSSGFTASISAACPEGHVTWLDLACRDSAGTVWHSDLKLVVGAPELEYIGLAVRDSAGNNNGRLDPNESAELVVTLYNSGFGVANHVRAVLRPGDWRLAATDSLADFGDVPGKHARANDADRFSVTAGLMVPQTTLPCTLVVSADGYSRKLPFLIVVGKTSSYDPIPDGPRLPPLYWAFDNSDTQYPEHPQYGWVELRGVGTQLTLADNQTVQIALPPEFGRFRYYGQDYDTISVCSNGWICPGRTTNSSWANRKLPSSAVPGLLAVAWDDLYPPFGNGVWYWHDAANHRFIVEWDSVHYRIPNTQFERFEVVLYDSTLAARDGNGEFCYQYRTANWYRSATVGMQDPGMTIGITSVSDTVYNAASARLVAGRAIKFTTDAPIPGIEESFKPQAASRKPGASIVRGVLYLAKTGTVPPGGLSPLLLLDATGRKVMGLRPGANDVSRLAPGVYFVVEARAQAQDVRRFVLTR